MSDDLDVADELAVIEYVSNPKNKKSSPRLEEQIINAKVEEAQSKCINKTYFW